MADDPLLPEDIIRVRQECELARACAWLAVCIAVAVLISNFGQASKSIGDAQEQVVVHQKILREHEELLRQNETALRDNLALLAARRTAPSPPK